MAISEKILDFGKNKGKALGACGQSYIKWLAQHPKRLREDHRHFAIAAKALLERKGEKVEKKGQVTEEQFVSAVYAAFRARKVTEIKIYPEDGKWVFAVCNQEVATANDKMTAFKKAIHAYGLLKDVMKILEPLAS